MSKKTETNEQSAAALVLSIISLAAWILPILGIPFSILVLILGFRSFESTKSQVAVGIGVLTLIAGVINALIGAQMGMIGG